MDLTWLEDFLALAEAGNFSRAAAARHITQPAFSRRIRALEDWAGVPLFDRATQPVSLTASGRALHQAAAELLRRTRLARDAARAACHDGHAALRFAATHVLSFTFFPAWLRGLEASRPFGAVQLVSDSLAACERLMLLGQAQFLLCHHHPTAPGALPEPQFAIADVGRDTLCPVAVPDAAGRPRFRLHRDEAAPLLAYSQASGLGRIVSAAAPADLQRAPVFTSHLAAALRSMALDGRGIAWLPLSQIAADLTAGRLCRAGGPALDIAVAIRLFRPAEDQDPEAERFWSLVLAMRGAN